ncbi:MAG TPA: methyltransferase domain-containing protein [Polyangia bacterium]
MNPNQALWEKGDFTRVAETMRESGDALVDKLGVVPGMNVLDVGCGDGTTALPAAERGARVLGIDIARNLVEAGNRRAAERGLANCTFRQGDATQLDGIADRSFDLVVSIFGAMFAPRPLDVARELVRVTRRGGRIVMGNWIPKDKMLVSRILEISASFSPPPPEGFVSPMRWGVEADVLERFAAAGVPAANVAFTRDLYTFDFGGSPEEFVALFRRFYGPTMNAFAAAEASGRTAELARELEALFVAQNRSGRPGQTLIPAGFLRVTVTL